MRTHHPLPITHGQVDHWVFEGWVRLDNRKALISSLHQQPLSHNPSDAEVILAAWCQWGTNCAQRLLGDFSFAITDTHSPNVYLVRDPMGVRPLYYRLKNDTAQYAFSLTAFGRGTPWEAEPDMEWVARYLTHLPADLVQTAYQGVSKVPPAHWLQVTPRGTQLERYFHWRDDAPISHQRSEHWVDAYRGVLEEAIRCRMPTEGVIGTENSGGIDSATITAYLAKLLGTPGDRLHTFGFAYADKEPAYILATSQDSQIIHNHIITFLATPTDLDEWILNGLSVLGYPHEHSNACGHIPFYKECQLHQIKVLFSGFGGDEVVTQQAHLLRYELIDRKDFRNLWDILPGPLWRRGASWAKDLTLGRRSPDYRPNFLAWWKARWQHQLLRPEVVKRLGLQDAYFETAKFDAPYRKVNDFILQHHLTHMHISSRLENCSLMAASYGVDYRWPLLDVRLVQQYLSTPSLEKRGPKGIGRYIHRRAISNLVPHHVSWKLNKDMGYGALSNKRQTLIASNQHLVNWKNHHITKMHPALLDLIDPEKIKNIGLQKTQDANQKIANSKNIASIAWLNHWLNRG